MWPDGALAQARWVHEQLEAGWTVPEIRYALVERMSLKMTNEKFNETLRPWLGPGAQSDRDEQ